MKVHVRTLRVVAGAALWIFSVAFLLPLHAQTHVIKFPADKAVNVNPDTHLVLTFASAPTLNRTGQIRIYDAADHKLVDTLDLSIPDGPDPSHRITPTPVKDINPHPATPTTTTPAVNYTPADLHNYQLTTVGGLANFHFHPVIIHGNVATIYPHNDVLQYHHKYIVKIDPGIFTFAQGAFAGYATDHAWAFSTKAASPVASKTRLIVAADGSGDFNTIQGAVDFIPENHPGRVTIFIKNGNYEEIVFFQHKANITFRGEDRDKVQVGYGNNSAFNPPMPGPSRRCAFSAYDSTGIEFFNFTVNNHYIGQAEALLISGSKNIVSRMNILGSGDGLNLRGSVYFVDSKIVGDGDTILNVGPAFFKHCIIESVGPFMWVRNPETNHGDVFVDSTFIGLDKPLPWTIPTPQNPNVTPMKAHLVLARLPDNHGFNYPYAESILINCHLKNVDPTGWSPLDGDTSHMHMWEYNSTDLDGKPVDVSQRNPASKELTMQNDAKAITDYSTPSFVLGGWTPVLSKDAQ